MMKNLGNSLAGESASRRWDKLCNKINSTALHTFGKISKACNLFDTKVAVIISFIEDKHSAQI